MLFILEQDFVIYQLAKTHTLSKQQDRIISRTVSQFNNLEVEEHAFPPSCDTINDAFSPGGVSVQLMLLGGKVKNI